MTTIGHVRVRGAIEPRPLVEHRGLLCRVGTFDARIVGEIEHSYGWLDVAGRRVMDIGANIGAFTCWAVRHGASYICAVEPDPSNFELLEVNFRRACHDQEMAGLPLPHYHLLRRAVTDGSTAEVNLWYPARGVNHGALSTTEFRGRTPATVPTMPFRSAVADYDIDTIKCDCEGAEYEFLDGDWLWDNGVTQVAAEIHLSRREWRDIQAPALVASYASWEVVRVPHIGPKNWTTIAGWQR